MSINGNVVWEKPAAYKNLVLTSTTDPGGTAIYNGVGYMDKMRWSSSGGAAVSANNQGRLTGWIPYKKGAVLRLKNFGLNNGNGYVSGCYIVMYHSNGTMSTSQTGWQSEDAFTGTLSNTTALYFRISGYMIDANKTPLTDPPIVTLDEEIT